MSPVPVTVVGAGRIGLLHARIIRDQVLGLEVVHVVDIDPAARDRAAVNGFATRADEEEAIADSRVEAVLVASATEAHVRHALLAITAGKAVFCEKPVATDLAGTDLVISAAREHDVPLQVGLHRRFDPAIAGAAAAVRAGEIGRPLLLRLTSRDPEPPPAGYQRAPGGLYTDSAIHDMDTALFVMQDEVVRISSHGAALFDPAAQAAGDIDTAATVLQFRSGALGLLDNCRISTRGFDQRLEVHGTDGTVLTENVPAPGHVLSTAGGTSAPRLIDFFPQRYADAYARQFTAFADVVRNGSAPAVTGEHARNVFLLALLAESARTSGRTLDVP